MVTNLINAKGNATVNQFVITEEEKERTAFQSYDSLVCEIYTQHTLGFRKVVRFGVDWDYSKTTMKHLCEFLRQNGCGCLASAKDIREGIDRGHARFEPDIAVIYDPTMR